MEDRKKIALFGGGGAFGAYIVGWLHIVRPSYKVLAGTSTGALIVILAALRKYDTLTSLYLGIDNSDMHLSKVNKGKFLRILALALYRTARNKRGLSDMGKTLERKVRENYSEEEHKRLIRDGIEVYVTAQCISHAPRTVEYFKNTECDYETFVKAVVASASVPVIAEPVQIRKHEWHCDGGISEGEPTRLAKMYPDADIDLFLNYPEEPKKEYNVAQNIFSTALQAVKILYYNVKIDDQVPLQGRNVHTVQPPYYLATNALNFEKEQMSNWHKIGQSVGKTYLKYHVQ